MFYTFGNVLFQWIQTHFSLISMHAEDQRIDKWLWAVRLFKTRSLAAEACKSNKVKSAGEPLKPSRVVKYGDIITIREGALTRTIKVLDFPKNRLGAKLLPEYMQDLTPADEYEKMKLIRQNTPVFDGKGRPTKKNRRELDDWMEEE
jgi:ribosome-associated heat shock protein Hsp15